MLPWAFDVNIVEFKLDDVCVVDLGMAGLCSLAYEIDPVGRSIRLYSTHEIMLLSEVELARQQAWSNRFTCKIREWLLEAHQRLHAA